MKLLKQRPNIVFMFFIIGVFIFFTATILLFHTSVNESAKSEFELSTQLETTQAKLNRTNQILLDIETELNKSKGDIQTFDTLYTETNDELAQTSATLDSTKSKLTKTESDLKEKIAQVVNLTNTNKELSLKVLADNVTITDLEKDVENLEDDLKDVCDTFSADTPPKECDDY